MKLFKGKSKEEIKAEIGKRDKSEIKWTRAVINAIAKGEKFKFDKRFICSSLYRPFVKKKIYFASHLNEMQYQLKKIFPDGKNISDSNLCIGFIGNDTVVPFSVLALNKVNDYNGLSNAANGTKTLPFYRYDANGERHDNMTDWGLMQFRENFNDKHITKEDIFHYTYAVLHHPVYRQKYELDLNREFPRLPFYEDFRQWVAWGRELMNLHINYETAKPFKLKRVDVKTSSKPHPKLKADKVGGTIELDSETVLQGVPPSAWEYKLGNRSALEWILDQYKEKKPSDATIAEKFNTYHFADYKEAVIDLLKRVCTVSVKTVEIINQMPKED